MANVDITVSLKTVTCHKGHFYAVPHWVDSWNCQCPMCAKDLAIGLALERDRAYEQRDASDRKIRSLKGALTKAKRRSEQG